MKKLVVTMLLTLLCNFGYAGVMWPDETSPQGLPEAIPCVTADSYNNVPTLYCVWLKNARQVEIYNPQQGRTFLYQSKVSGQCIRGKCRTKAEQVGVWSEDIQFVLSIWYYIGASSDGKPVAYRIDRGPAADHNTVSYAEAGTLMYEFYLDSGLNDQELNILFDQRYEGGVAQWEADKVGAGIQKVSTGSSDWPDVISAWCNPRADDDCYINDEKVARDDLDKYLPPVSQLDVDTAGGYCEIDICFDGKDKPFGLLQ